MKFCANVYDVKLLKKDGGGFRLSLDIGEVYSSEATSLWRLAPTDAEVEVNIEVK